MKDHWVIHAREVCICEPGRYHYILIRGGPQLLGLPAQNQPEYWISDEEMILVKLVGQPHDGSPSGLSGPPAEYTAPSYIHDKIMKKAGEA